MHTVLTDNGTHFTTPGNIASAACLIKEAIVAGETFRAHSFELACARNDIKHRLTKPRHPWTNGQAERMNRTIKDATVKRYHYDSHAHLRAHLADFVSAYNFAGRLKTLRGLAPYEAIYKAWSAEPFRFNSNQLHQMLGPNIKGCLASADGAQTRKRNRTVHSYGQSSLCQRMWRAAERPGARQRQPLTMR